MLERGDSVCHAYQERGRRRFEGSATVVLSSLELAMRMLLFKLSLCAREREHAYYTHPFTGGRVVSGSSSTNPREKLQQG